MFFYLKFEVKERGVLKRKFFFTKILKTHKRDNFHRTNQILDFENKFASNDLKYFFLIALSITLKISRFTIITNSPLRFDK